MKKILIFFVIFFLIFTICKAKKVSSNYPLLGKNIIVDPGHGGKDPGTTYKNIYEKNLNLSISLKLEKELIKNGASVILTRDDDYDLSSPNTERRKKSDFDNRIKLINNTQSDIYLSIHINRLDDSSYSGGQIFYYGEKNKLLAEYIQKEFNYISYPRSIKKMPDIYMYKRLKKRGVLIECGFISNEAERNKLITDDYQNKIAVAITNGIINYFH